MSFLKRIFWRKKPEVDPKDLLPAILGEEDYKGYKIQALDLKQENEALLAGKIIKIINGETREQDFIRADRMNNKEQALDAALKKGRQIIDQQGDALFRT
ncbi:MAG: hypothetical protein HRU28_06430 [Rhizobiales bacterium]|nr:hypothetical protein [Hyphomicrobiales bacterium]